MNNDPIVCTCNEIRKSEIELAIRGKNLKTIDQVLDETSAGTVCGGCVDDIFLILEEINGNVEL